jgi:catechol 2,3-dioxygenase-like lactoylglutathione lyase family enzyme
MLGSNDLERSKKFYDAVLGAMGAKPGTQDARGRLVYAHDGGRLMLTKPIDGKPASCANGGTLGFRLPSSEALFTWHKAGVENGGTAIEDPPGMRGAGGVYLAYLRDPDGNKLCAVHRSAA